jgi:hypothetical protein
VFLQNFKAQSPKGIRRLLYAKEFEGLMSEKLFLYIDILGFSELVSDRLAMSQIFDRIDDLNVHSDGEFGVIAFSDTILIYADGGWLGRKDQAIMWLVEFAQDLFYRFIGIDRHFRAYLTFGDFNHTKKSHIEAYYGEALVECYKKEKTIKAMGVFMANELVPYSDIFDTTQYDADCHFVHIMQTLDYVSGPNFEDATYPIHSAIIDGTDVHYLLAYDLAYLRNVYEHASDATLPEPVRLKYSNTWKLIHTRHGRLLDALVQGGFDPNSIVKFPWAEAMARVGTPEGTFG